MTDLKLKEEFIRLGQALKAAHLCDMGSDAKQAIQGGLVKVNQETELRRGRKLYAGDLVEYDGTTIRIVE